MLRRGHTLDSTTAMLRLHKIGSRSYGSLLLFTNVFQVISIVVSLFYFIFLQETIDLLAVKERRLVVPMIAALLKT